MKNQYHNLTEEERNELLKLLQNLKRCSMEQLLPGKQIQLTLNGKITRNKKI